MLLRDADIKEAVAVQRGESGQTRARRHRRRDRTDARVLVRKTAQLRAEARREVLLLLRKKFARHAVELRYAVIFLRIVLARRVAASLLRHHVQQHRLFHLFRLCQQLADALEVVAVHRAEIGKSHLLEQRRRQQEALDARLGARDRLRQRPSARNTRELFLDTHFRTQITRTDAQARQMTAQAADILRDRHIVVVQNDEQRLARRAGIRKRLIRHAAGQRAVADDRDNVVFLVSERARVRHAERDRNRVRGVARDARVGNALLRLHEARKAAVLPQR